MARCAISTAVSRMALVRRRAIPSPSGMGRMPFPRGRISRATSTAATRPSTRTTSSWSILRSASRTSSISRKLALTSATSPMRQRRSSSSPTACRRAGLTGIKWKSQARTISCRVRIGRVLRHLCTTTKVSTLRKRASILTTPFVRRIARVAILSIRSTRITQR